MRAAFPQSAANGRRRQDRDRRQQQSPPRPEAKAPLSAEEALRVLGLDRSASWDDIRGAYKRLAHEHHPDKHAQASQQQQAEAAKRFRACAEAFEVLKRSRQQ
jgi:DnaJ-domain-containing protein 1